MVLEVGSYRGGVPKQDATPLAKAKNRRGLGAIYAVALAGLSLTFLVGGLIIHHTPDIYAGLAFGAVSAGCAAVAYKANQQIKVLLQSEESQHLPKEDGS